MPVATSFPRPRHSAILRAVPAAAAFAGLSFLGSARADVLLDRTLTPSTVDLGNVARPVNLPGYTLPSAFIGDTTVTTADPSAGYTRLGIGTKVFDSPGDSAVIGVSVFPDASFNTPGSVAGTTSLYPFDLDTNHSVSPLSVPWVATNYAQAFRTATVHVVGPPWPGVPLLTDYVQVDGNGGAASIDGPYQLGAVIASKSLSGSQLFSFVQGQGTVQGEPEAFQIGTDGREFAYVRFDTDRALAGYHKATLSLAFNPVVPGGNTPIIIQGLQIMPTVDMNVFRRVYVSGAGASTGGGITLDDGDNYAGVGATSEAGTTAQLLAGQAGGSRNLEMSFSDGGPNLASDVAHFSGTGTDLFVIQMSYQPGFTNVSDADNLRLLWADLSRNEYVNAVDGNTYSSSPPNYSLTTGGYSSTNLQLGQYGIDTTNHVVWAVVNHNSDFAVGFAGTAIPEPASLSLLALGGLALLRRRRRGAN